MSMIRSRWAAIGAAVAVTLGGTGAAFVSATSPSDATAFVPITPCRVMDTRPGPDNVGPRATPLGADETYTVDVAGESDMAGDCDGVIPASATAISMNVTTLGATEPSFLTIWEAGQPRPDTSVLNPTPGQPPTPNAVTTGLSLAGEFSIYHFTGAVNVIADITGYHVDHDHDDRYSTRREVAALVEGQQVLADGASHGAGLRALGDNIWTEVEAVTMEVPSSGRLVVVGSGYVTTSAGSSLSCVIAHAGTSLSESSRTVDTSTGSCSTNASIEVTDGVHTVELRMRTFGGAGFVQPSTLDVLFVPDPL